jgi:glucose/arabinose dehydrogenase
MARGLTCYAAVFVVALASPVAAQFRGEVIVRGLVNPLAVVADPTDRAVLLIVEQRGLVRVARSGTVLEQPFLDLRGDVRAGGEQGLLGLALAPDYADSGRLFVNFTNRNGDTVIARFRRDADNPFQADRNTRFELLWPDNRRVIDQPFENHNGGHLAFGPDGYLYVGLGDGGSAGDPMNRAQNPQALLGKMLRLDVSVDDEDPRGYRVPEDNPFVDGEPIRALPEIWAFGLRNPWRYSFDDWTRGGTSALVIGDVGQNAREEINFEPSGRSGRNYGWRLREGRQAFNANTAAAFGPLTEPIHDYGRSIGASITGGLIYRGAALDPGFGGRYFYADYVSGRVFSIGLHLDPAGEASADDEREHTERLGGRSTLGNVSSFSQDHDGELLLVNYAAGTIVKVVPDFNVVPMAPAVSASRGRTGTEITWTRPENGVDAVAYSVERIRGRTVVERRIVERPVWAIDPGVCVRVRAVARNGLSGPPSSPLCTP